MELASTSIKQKVIKIDKGHIAMRRHYSSEELLRYGVINLDKPKGPKCKYVLSEIHEILDVEKIGHAGTLDPNTTGVLPILLGKATKLSEILSTSDKIYRGKFKLHGEISKKKLERCILNFVGEIKQLPPKISAVKREIRTRRVYWFKILRFKDRVVSFEMACQHGTYVRKICHDLGEELGVGAHMFELQRIQSGPFKLRKSVSMDVVRKLASKRKYNKFVSKPEHAVKYVPKVWVDSAAIETVLKGTPVFVPGVLRVTNDFDKEKVVAIFGQDNKLKALGVAKMSVSELKKLRRGIAIKTDLVLTS